ncbi:two-component system response regulator [Actinomycetospora sp. TBRC 11914]|uniref:response regulator n=1 Tax=Actinomycetospora sp. TBRC 11914 TaxID=2729387 RepID=UPI00145E3FEF|nr:response regulator [Actinomycetospora sp. TBRC 11914]NMO92929.1 response regulator [Actinomycetospora sp. TBRC 11914]
MRSVPTPRVLAVDDRRENLVALEAILADTPVEVDTVIGGEEALKRLLTHDYALIVLDAHMPGMSGYETAEHIKEREKTRHIPILFLTAADSDSGSALRGYRAGAVDYMVKPLSPWVLRSKVEVFADLWTVQAELARQAQHCRMLLSAVGDAVQALEGPAADVDRVATGLREALEGASPTLRAAR